MRYLMKKYELYSIIIISPMPDRIRHVLSILSWQASAWDRFLETADQTSQRDYRPNMIGNWSIGAPLVETVMFFFK